MGIGFKVSSSPRSTELSADVWAGGLLVNKGVFGDRSKNPG